MYRNFTIILLITLVFVLFPCLEASSEEFVENQLIIKVRPGVSNNTIQGILNQNGLSRTRSIPNLNVLLISLPSGASLDAMEKVLSHNPNFKYVERNYMRYALLVPNDRYYSLQYHHPKIEDPQAWNISTGDGSVVIAVLDTGVQANHPDLSGKVLTGNNFVGSYTSTNTDDDNGHGTGVAGTAAAIGNNSTGVAGVCWGCKILPVKVLNSQGSGTLFDIIEGINFVANYAANNPGKKVVINMSFGGTCSSGTSEQDAINNAWNNGVVIIAAAGNNGNSIPVCPASRNNVITVSATDQNDSLASFSSFGSFIDVSAPGVDIPTTWRNSSYVYASGTSFSSPITAGVAGLIWSVNPGLTNNEVAQLIKDTSDDLGSAGYDTKFGYGRINTNTAVQAAGGGPSPTPTPASSDTIPPQVKITQPSNGAVVSGSVAVTVSASDNIKVAKVDFYIDGNPLSTDTSSPYSATWNSSAASRGTHTIKAVATDTSGNAASYQIAVYKLF